MDNLNQNRSEHSANTYNLISLDKTTEKLTVHTLFGVRTQYDLVGAWTIFWQAPKKFTLCEASYRRSKRQTTRSCGCRMNERKPNHLSLLITIEMPLLLIRKKKRYQSIVVMKASNIQKKDDCGNLLGHNEIA